ncbi:hypothetical protein AMS68_004045 [Peltaster fructicola]|uniref:NAD(P)-binding protein n=1 Tax=Peltaster fructicola TaxID=286661 RepID=A0A6H0XV89_9PEZI|nr:hypothetical protein AMS68_004045 [Peltaster fructicola]
MALLSPALHDVVGLQLPASTDPPLSSHPAKHKVWIVFGATGHIGRSLVKSVLAHGDQVTAVGRMMENTLQQMQGWHEHCLGMLCDVRVRPTVQAVMDKSVERWGRIDIIVNCTGYGVLGACEDQDACDLRSQFDINFMGTLNIIQLSLPIFRQQAANRDDDENAGRYIIFSSTSGALGVPGLGPYCATKYATEGLVESMLYEVDAFGIKATLVQPGHMRLNEPGSGGSAADTLDTREDGTDLKLRKYGHFLVKKSSEPYDTPTAPASHAKRVVQWLLDRQPVSAFKSAELVWQLGHCRYPPLRLILGSYAVESVRDRLRSVTEEIEDWKHLSFGVSDTRDKTDSKDAQDDEQTGEGEHQGHPGAMDDATAMDESIG